MTKMQIVRVVTYLAVGFFSLFLFSRQQMKEKNKSRPNYLLLSAIIASFLSIAPAVLSSWMWIQGAVRNACYVMLVSYVLIIVLGLRVKALEDEKKIDVVRFYGMLLLSCVAALVPAFCMRYIPMDVAVYISAFLQVCCLASLTSHRKEDNEE